MNTLTSQGPIQGSCLWTSAWPSTLSYLKSSLPNSQLAVSPPICQWSSSFLCNRSQHVWPGDVTPSTQTTDPGFTTGVCPLLFSLYMSLCTTKDLAVKLLKSADPTDIGLNNGGWFMNGYNIMKAGLLKIVNTKLWTVVLICCKCKVRLKGFLFTAVRHKSCQMTPWNGATLRESHLCLLVSLTAARGCSRHFMDSDIS